MKKIKSYRGQVPTYKSDFKSVKKVFPPNKKILKRFSNDHVIENDKDDSKDLDKISDALNKKGIIHKIDRKNNKIVVYGDE